MRIIMHAAPPLLVLATEAVHDVLKASDGTRDTSKAWTRGWRGAATITAGDLLVEAHRRNSGGRRRIRISVGPEAMPQGVDPSSIPASLRLRLLADVLASEDVAYVAGTEPSEEDAANRRLVNLELGLHLPLDEWSGATAHPGSPRTAPRIEVRLSDGAIVELGDASTCGAWVMPAKAEGLLIDDAVHVQGVEVGRDVLLRMGTAPSFGLKAPGASDLLRLAAPLEI